jgi:y4mF family transcriptional regulator
MEFLDSPARFGALVRRRRQVLGLTQRDLALAVNVGERFIVDLEGGKATCQIGKALAVAKGVGIRLADAAEADGNDDLPEPGEGA